MAEMIGENNFMEINFFEDIRFIELSQNNQKLIISLIQKFEDKKIIFSLHWRGYSSKKKQFTLKRADPNFNGSGVIITAIVLVTCRINIEVHGGKYRVGNLFKYSENTTIEELNDLFSDIDKTIMKINI